MPMLRRRAWPMTQTDASLSRSAGLRCRTDDAFHVTWQAPFGSALVPLWLQLQLHSLPTQLQRHSAPALARLQGSRRCGRTSATERGDAGEPRRYGEKRGAVPIVRRRPTVAGDRRIQSKSVGSRSVCQKPESLSFNRLLFRAAAAVRNRSTDYRERY